MKQVITEQEEAAKVVNDEELTAVGQRMNDTERKENVNVVQRLRLNDVPMLMRSGDLLASAETDANAAKRPIRGSTSTNASGTPSSTTPRMWTSPRPS